MTKRMYSWAVLSVLMIGFVPALPACDDMANSNDLVDLQNQQRLDRGIPGPTELPPGLGDDLPPPTPAAPIATDK